MFRELRGAGVPVQDLDELRRLASEVRAADFSGNEDILREESQKALSLVEQIELALQRAADQGGSDVRVAGRPTKYRTHTRKRSRITTAGSARPTTKKNKRESRRCADLVPAAG